MQQRSPASLWCLSVVCLMSVLWVLWVLLSNFRHDYFISVISTVCAVSILTMFNPDLFLNLTKLGMETLNLFTCLKKTSPSQKNKKSKLHGPSQDTNHGPPNESPKQKTSSQHNFIVSFYTIPPDFLVVFWQEIHHNHPNGLTRQNITLHVLYIDVRSNVEII